MPTKPPTFRVRRPVTPVHYVVPSPALAPDAPVERWGQGRGGRPWRRLRIEVFERDLYTCQVCGRVGREHELDADHVTPVSEGGTDDMDNLQTLCRTPCHRDKTTREAARAANVKRT